MFEVGILVNRLGIDQKSYTIINSLNKATQENTLCPILFFLEYGKTPKTCLFSKMQAKEAWCYPHPIIANDIETAELLIECPRPSSKYLYMWDMKWLYFPKNFEKYHNIIHSLDIITRCTSHSKLIEKCWLKTNYIVEDFDYDSIKKVLSGR